MACNSFLVIAVLSAFVDTSAAHLPTLSNAATIRAFSEKSVELRSVLPTVPTLASANCALPINRTRNWGAERFEHCTLDMNWNELAMQEYICSNSAWTGCEIEFQSGGLGALEVANLYVSWVCVKDHVCREGILTSYFCFVYNELADTFIPWYAR